ncbi:MAG: hypothetical protein ACK4IY_04095, partial [Chitinophagales bacterium]
MFFSFSGFIQSCYYDNAEDLLGSQGCDTAAVSFSADVVPILQSNCYVCHSQASGASSGGGIILEGYDFIFDSTTPEKVTASIDWLSSASAMPKGGSQLPACERAIIRNW